MSFTRLPPGIFLFCLLFFTAFETPAVSSSDQNAVAPSSGNAHDSEAAAIQRICRGGDASVLLVLDDRDPLISISADAPRIPASVLKIATALFVLETLGPEYRFETDFYFNENRVLTVRASGDPFLISEEWAVIADSLSAGIDTVSSIRLVDDAFAPGMTIPGTGESGKPFDACINAFCTNFNTCAVTVRNSEVFSAEKQTPLTESARRLAFADGRRGTFRFSLDSKEKVHLYTEQILASFLDDQGVVLLQQDGPQVLEDHGSVLYTHRSTRTLESMVESMMLYSNNLVANHLLLAAGKPASGRIDLGTAVASFDSFLTRRVGIKGFDVSEGAGISRKNKFTASQVAALLETFYPYRKLLSFPDRYKKTADPPVRLKTGTMEGIETAAGYIQTDKGGSPYRFVVLLDGAPPGARDRIVDLLVRLVTGRGD